MTVKFIAADNQIIPISRVERFDFQNIERGEVVVHTLDGNQLTATDFDAFKIAGMFHTEMEGRRLVWKKNAWAVHNLIAHPLLQILSWVGLTKLGIRIHDRTIPQPIALRNIDTDTQSVISSE